MLVWVDGVNILDWQNRNAIGLSGAQVIFTFIIAASFMTVIILTMT